MIKKIDIIIYGATGFTGKLCVNYLKKNYPDLNWAIAGRNIKKLIDIQKYFSLDCEIFIADGDDTIALDKMTKKTKIVLSTAGPFHRYGSKLVASCVKNNTDYVDITGETFWIKEMIDKHHIEAKNKSIRIIPSCGFDSIPSDLGVLYASSQFGKNIKSIHSFYKLKGQASGGTIETMFSIKENKKKSNLLGRFLLTPENSISDFQNKNTNDRQGIKKNIFINAWTGPFIMAITNSNIVRRSSALLAERGLGYGKNFIYTEKVYYSNLWSSLLGTLLLAMFGFCILSPLNKIIRFFLKKPGEGPTQKIMDSGFIKSKFLVHGENGQNSIYEIFGKGDPGYKLTSMFVCESACSLLEPKSKLPGGDKYGGILTPATGLGDVLIKRLIKAGIIFKKVI